MSVDRDPAQLHVPVLLNECLDMLAPAIDAPGAVLIDATLGMGGHTEAALTRFPELTVFGIDRDPSAIALASKRLEARVSVPSTPLTTRWMRLLRKLPLEWSMGSSWIWVSLRSNWTKRTEASLTRMMPRLICE